MNKLFFIVLCLFSSNTLLYASFPINNILVENNDTLQVETILEYHQRMESMGFDISLCKCEYCRKNLQARDVSLSKNFFTNALVNVGLLLLVFFLIVGFILLYLIIKSVSNWLDDGAPFL